MTFFSPAEVVGMAVETERAGHQYYELAAKKANGPAVAELFTFLAGEEVKHEHVFAALYEKIREKPADLPFDWDELMPYLKVITDSRFFLGKDKAMALVQSARDEQEALAFALRFEKETLLFYLEITRFIAEPHRSVIGEVARQERMHIRRLSEMIAARPGA
jgi:rubrerythrin